MRCTATPLRVAEYCGSRAHDRSGDARSAFCMASAFVQIADVPADDAYRADDPRATRAGRSRRRAHALAVPLRKDEALLGSICRLPPGGAAVLRQADRAAAELRGAGGDRDGECAAARRIARAHARSRRVARIPDRDQRRAQGHQPLDLRSAAGARHARRDRRAALRGRYGGIVTSREGEVYRRGGARSPIFAGVRRASTRPFVCQPGRGTVTGRTAAGGPRCPHCRPRRRPGIRHPEAVTVGISAPRSVCRYCAKASRSA